MNGDQIYQALLKRGYSPPQAAALTGNILQESGGDPTRPNEKEGAHGLLQWRLDRWRGLQDYAASRGTSPYDPDTQLDYIGVEMASRERRSGRSFKAAGDVESANDALKGYIRYGDDSQGKRLSYARVFLDGTPAATASTPSRRTESTRPAPGAAETSGPVKYLDEGAAAQRALDRRTFPTAANVPNPDARYLVRVPKSADGGTAGAASANVAPSAAPSSFDDRFGDWLSPPRTAVSVPPAAAPPDIRPSFDGHNTGFGIYRYPTDGQIAFDSGSLSATPTSAASPDASFLAQIPAPVTGPPAVRRQSGLPRPTGGPSGAAAPTNSEFAPPSSISTIPLQSKREAGEDNWLSQWLGSILSGR